VSESDQTIEPRETAAWLYFAYVAASVLGLILSFSLIRSCQGEPDVAGPQDTTAESSVPAQAVPPVEIVLDDAVMSVRVEPGSDPSAVDAQDDLISRRCVFHDDHWDVAGVLLNTSPQPADYRVYAMFRDIRDRLAAVFQVDVVGVTPGDRGGFDEIFGFENRAAGCSWVVERLPVVAADAG
jgi:hypothetical protein